jgi:hypothetical protein
MIIVHGYVEKRTVKTISPKCCLVKYSVKSCTLNGELIYLVRHILKIEELICCSLPVNPTKPIDIPVYLSIFDGIIEYTLSYPYTATNEVTEF